MITAFEQARCAVPERMQGWTLNECEGALRRGEVSEVEVEVYLLAWNLTPCRFTTAYLRGGEIRQETRP
jgi:hypothetical protein